MSRGNIFQGQASGKLGDAVLMVRNGQQLARVYTKAGARSGKDASEAARIQRVKFGSASNQWSLYRYVCTRMFRKGRKSTQSDYNYFVKRNASLLPYFTKQENADGVHVLMPGLMAEGNLGRIALLQSVLLPIGEGLNNLYLYDSNKPVSGVVEWSKSMGRLKLELRLSYPAARKVTYLFSYASSVSIEEEGEEFVSQQVVHDPVTVDLYKELTPGEDEKTIAEYFSSHIDNQVLRSIIASQVGTMMGAKANVMLKASNSTELSHLENTGILMFATDDNVSDCYSTLLEEGSVDPAKGVYSLYHSYRTQESLRIACDSYGYQSGVMRDEVASAGNSISEVVAQYAARLSAVDPDAGKVYMESVGDLSTVKAKTVRVATPENKKG